MIGIDIAKMVAAAKEDLNESKYARMYFEQNIPKCTDAAIDIARSRKDYVAMSIFNDAVDTPVENQIELLEGWLLTFNYPEYNKILCSE